MEIVAAYLAGCTLGAVAVRLWWLSAHPAPPAAPGWSPGLSMEARTTEEADALALRALHRGERVQIVPTPGYTADETWYLVEAYFPR